MQKVVEEVATGDAQLEKMEVLVEVGGLITQLEEHVLLEAHFQQMC